MRRTPRPQSFEHFYHTKVGLGEGCGCAERIIDNHEIDRLARARQLGLGQPGLLKRLWSRLTGTSGAPHETPDD